MGRKKKPVDVEEPENTIDNFDLFARKPGRSVVMTHEASEFADDTRKKPKVSARTKDAVCEIRRKK